MLIAAKRSAANDLEGLTLHVIEFQPFPSVREREAIRAEQSCFGERRNALKIKSVPQL